MHELGLCASIVDAVEQRAAGRPVARVQSFAVAAMGTVADATQAELVMLPVRARCTRCGVTWEGESLPELCAACSSVDLELIGGDELILESVEYRG